jgi:phosphohistidine phosphatase
MRVTLIRHGEAGEDAPRDEERTLTKKGRSDSRRVGRALGRVGARFGAVVSSPLVRAVQTAELVVASAGHRGRVLVSDSLLPEASPDGAVAFLAALADGDERSVALVAHEPILSRLGAKLLGVARLSPLRKAEAIRIRLPDGPKKPGAFRWRIDPESGKRRRK